MAKTPMGHTEEQRGSLPACTGARLKIVSIERTKTGENSKTPGALMYMLIASVVEPKGLRGMQVRDWMVVGTAEDPRAKQEETWQRSEGGPGKLKRLLTRSGTPISDDDEEWMEAAEGNEFVAPITARLGDNGEIRNGIGLVYRVTDEDAPVIGIADEQSPVRGGGKGKSPAGAASAARGKARVAEPDDEDEIPASEAKSAKPAPVDDDADDEDEKPAPKAKGKAKAKPKVDDDEDDDED